MLTLNVLLVPSVALITVRSTMRRLIPRQTAVIPQILVLVQVMTGPTVLTISVPWDKEIVTRIQNVPDLLCVAKTTAEISIQMQRVAQTVVRRSLSQAITGKRSQVQIAMQDMEG